MSENPTADEWAGARGRKWRDQLDAMEAMLSPVDAPLLKALHLDGAHSVADIGCGGGGTTGAIAGAASEGCQVTGFDISEDLITEARARAAGLPVTFEQADIQTHRPGARFDRLCSRFGIMFYPDPPAAFANLRQWLVPGGRFAFAAWGRPADNPWMSDVRSVLGELIDIEAPPADAPGPFRYGEAEALVTLLEAAGFAEIAVTPWRGKLALGGGLEPAAACEFVLSSLSVGELLNELPAQIRAKGRERLTAHLAGRVEDGVVRMKASVNIFTGSAAPDQSATR